MKNMIKKRWLQTILLGIGLALTLSGSPFASVSGKSQPKVEPAMLKLLQAAPDFKAATYQGSENRMLRYRLLEPERNRPEVRYPLVVFLSGTNERGTNNVSQLKFAGPYFDNQEARQEYPCYVILPQCPAEQNWVPKESSFGSVTLAAEAAEPSRLTVELILSLERHFNIDPKRIYIMGVSSGASGVWDLAARYPEMFAAAVPFAGCGDPNQAGRLNQTPFWIFHGALDVLVNPHCSRLMYQAMKNAGGQPRFTEYSLTGHTCWVKAFQNPELLQWLFAQHRT